MTSSVANIAPTHCFIFVVIPSCTSPSVAGGTHRGEEVCGIIPLQRYLELLTVATRIQRMDSQGGQMEEESWRAVCCGHTSHQHKGHTEVADGIDSLFLTIANGEGC